MVLAHNGESQAADGLTLAELDSLRDGLGEDYFDFVVPTEYVPRLPALGELRQAEERSDGTALGFATSASNLIHKRFLYVKGATNVNSSIADSLSVGAGVCQDFAHLLLGLVRGRGLPARYVSG